LALEKQDLARNEIVAIVIFDTRYGNTGKIAKSFETGLKEAGIQTVCVNAKDVAVESLKEYDLICIGAPTEAFSASKPMKQFLGRLKTIDLSGKHGFAFDTKLDSHYEGERCDHWCKTQRRRRGEVRADWPPSWNHESAIWRADYQQKRGEYYRQVTQNRNSKPVVSRAVITSMGIATAAEYVWASCQYISAAATF
jgi:flavodoxin